jgi:lupus La protein
MSVSVSTDDAPTSLTAAEPASPDLSMHDDESLAAARKQGVFSKLFHPSSTNPSHLPVEFYFADSNLPYDKYAPNLLFRSFIQTDLSLSRFMWTLHTANADHWVPIKTVSSFKRMREHTAKGPEFILRALKTSTEVEVDDEGENVRRATELQKPKDQFERSVYAVRSFSQNPFRGGTNRTCVFQWDRKGSGRRNRVFNKNWRRFSKNTAR